MPIGDIQLTTAAMPTDTQPKGESGVFIGMAPTDTKLPEELKDRPLPRETLEVFLFELQNQPNWRREADRAADYYDSNQLSPETVETLKDRGQPPLVTNLIKPTIDTVLGLEAKTRTDWKVRPEDDEVAEDDLAEALSLKLKHAETESRADRAVSDSYAAQIKAGLGWCEVARESDPFKFPYRASYVHRREIYWDWRSEKPDLSDARYLIRRRWLEVDHAISMMPQYAELLRQTTSGWAGFDPVIENDPKLVQSWEVERDTRLQSNDWRDTMRQRVCLYEVWYRRWVSGYVMTLPNGRTLEVDFNNPRHNEVIVAGLAKVKRATFQKIRLAWYCGPHFLYDVPSPYKHGNFPYVPFFGHREDLTNVPYGLIRAMISPQDEINARKSKMLWSLNSRRVVTDSDAVKDHNRTAQEVARPDAYVILDANRKPNSTFKVEPGGELAAQQFQVMQEAKQEIAEASGIHKSLQGQQSGATSGLAINSLVEQGLNTLAEINDNYRYARRLVGEMLFSLMQEDLSQGQTNVTIGQGKSKKVIVLNEPAMNEETGQPYVKNDVAKVRAKIVLDDVPSSQTFKLQQLQMLSEVMKALPPNAQASMMDFYVDATDLPNRHKMVDRLRKVMNIPDDSPEAMQAQAEQAQQQAQLQMQQVAQAMAEQSAKTEKMHAEAARILAETRRIMAEARITAQTDPDLQNDNLAADTTLKQANADYAIARTLQAMNPPPPPARNNSQLSP
jgi:hypothetical protein